MQVPRVWGSVKTVEDVKKEGERVWVSESDLMRDNRNVYSDERVMQRCMS